MQQLMLDCDHVSSNQVPIFFKECGASNRPSKLCKKRTDSENVIGPTAEIILGPLLLTAISWVNI